MFEQQIIKHKRIYEPKEQDQAKRFSDKLKKDNIEFKYAHEYVFGGVATIITWEEKKITCPVIKNPKK